MGDAIMDAIAYETTASDAVPEALYVALPEKGPRPLPSAREIIELNAKRNAALAEEAERVRAAQLQADTIVVTHTLDDQIHDLAFRGWRGMDFECTMPQGMTKERFIEVGKRILNEPPYKCDGSSFQLKLSETDGWFILEAKYKKPAEEAAVVAAVPAKEGEAQSCCRLC